MQTSVSEVAQIREQIAAEYMAGKLGLEGLNSGTPRHAFITARQEHIAVLHSELRKIVGDEAIAMVIEICDSLPDTPGRSEVLAVLRHVLGNEEGELLCARLQEIWKSVDSLRERFGEDPARKMLLAPSPSLQEIPPS